MFLTFFLYDRWSNEDTTSFLQIKYVWYSYSVVDTESFEASSNFQLLETQAFPWETK